MLAFFESQPPPTSLVRVLEALMLNMIKSSFTAFTVTALLLGGTIPGLVARAAADCCKPGAACCYPGSPCCAGHHHAPSKP